MATITDINSVAYSGDLRVDSLLYDGVDWNYLLPTRTTLYYTFDLGVVSPATPYAVTGFNAAQRAAAVQIFNLTTGITGIQFAQVASGAQADLHLAVYNLAGANTTGLTQTSERYGYTSGDVLTYYEGEAFVFLDNVEFAYMNTTPVVGSDGYEVLLHEIAHALGLGHPFDGVYRLAAGNDNTNNTLMSYTHAGDIKATYQQYDLLALSWLYGEDGLRGGFGINSLYGPSVGTGVVPSAPVDATAPTLVTVTPVDEATGVALDASVMMTFSETLSRGGGTILLKNNAGTVIEAFDAASSSRLTVSGSTLTINPLANLAHGTVYQLELPVGALTDLAGNAFAGTHTYNFTTVPDPADQTFRGTLQNDFFRGGTGNDTLHGGGGMDTALYSGPVTDYAITYQRAKGTATITDRRSGGDGTDSLHDIERLQFADKSFDLLNLPRTAAPSYGETGSFLFDASYYLLRYPELVPHMSLATAYEHYLWVGGAQGKSPNVWFDPVYYANKWADLKPLNLSAATLFTHYNLYGVWEGRSAGPAFDRYDGARYLGNNPDVAAYVDANVSDFLGSRSNGAIAHYVIFGADEGRTAYDLAGATLDLAILIGVQPG